MTRNPNTVMLMPRDASEGATMAAVCRPRRPQATALDIRGRDSFYFYLLCVVQTGRMLGH
jgi:hypothetical protein